LYVARASGTIHETERHIDSDAVELFDVQTRNNEDIAGSRDEPARLAAVDSSDVILAAHPSLLEMIANAIT
jgi:hypothetical protein